MVFSELAFIFHFFPIFLITYYIARGKARNIVLLLGSLIFYALGNPLYVLLLIASVLINYLTANRIQTIYARVREADPWRDEDTFNSDNEDDEMNIIDLDEEDETDRDAEDKDKKLDHKPAAATIWLITGLIYNLGVLCIFKYLDFILEVSDQFFATGLKGPNLALPLGISFYTFQMISFIVDVYREDTENRVSFLHFAAYSTMFPQIASGPITRYGEVKETLDRVKGVRASYLEKGMIAFTLGLGYKVLLADKIAALWNDVWRVGALGVDVATAWLGAWAYSMQIYFDFWGYSLMAMGVAGMLGFNLPVNFSEPYSSKTMTGFWRNWHITLGRWFKDYIYIPMGGNRCGKIRMLFNMLVVWLLTGIWHGAGYNFIIWGLFLFVILMIEKLTYGKWMEKTKVIGHIYMIILIPVSWTIFNITDITELSNYLLRMVGVPIEGMVVYGFNQFVELITTYWWIMGLCILFATPYPMRFIKKFRKSIVVKLLLLCIFWYSVYQIARSGDNPFIYFQF